MFAPKQEAINQAWEYQNNKFQQLCWSCPSKGIISKMSKWAGNGGLCSALHSSIPLSALDWAQSNANSLFSPSLRFSALICVAIIVANQTRLLKQCWEQLIEVLRKSSRAFILEVTWHFLSWLKQTFLVPWASVGLIKRVALTLWKKGVLKRFTHKVCELMKLNKKLAWQILATGDP